MTWAFRFAAESFPQKQEFVKIPNEICVNGIGKDPHKKIETLLLRLLFSNLGKFGCIFTKPDIPEATCKVIFSVL